ncbi:N-acetyltransferase domain-containing protein [Mycena sanguinolenta]|uniref:N-acetyltransferase domain-containing protein n=1 Tax=Mycena sanguinolenta TaxID=230812 RepID=A0A8H7CWK3_9AGAR|nr:N-acetyltransferase domain-containing protein [Mycena sanguinolenta]
MPAVTLQSYITTYFSASSLPNDVWDALRSNPCNSNCILPIAIKSLAQEQNYQSALPSDQCWIVVKSNGTIDFVVSVTNGDIGGYPIFFFTTHPIHQLTYDFLSPRLIRLAEALRVAVPVERVYSIFAPDVITKMFIEIWNSLTGVQGCKEPYYHAKLTYCTRRSFVNRQMTTLSGLVYELRPAVDDDLEAVASLCYQFAADSEPFVLSHKEALKEAATLIRNKQIWVHGIRLADDVHDEIASIVAFTRNSENVATISKVFTNPVWRRRGCAERLVRRVCKHLLATKQSVALYVAHNNPAATHVYHRVGFQGLADGCAPVEGVDSWLEVGFDRSKVELGHW